MLFKKEKIELVRLGIGDWGLGIGPNPQSPYKLSYLIHEFIIIFDYLSK